MTPLPRFATNRPDKDETVAGAIKDLFSSMREALKDPPALSIATAYINPGGFSLLADELSQAPRIRLLLGAEPDPAVTRSIEAHHPDAPVALEKALESHVGWLSAARDAMGFTKDSVETAKLMVEWLESQTEDGSARVEVRRFSHGFLHGKAFIAEGALKPEMLAGSSNMTYAGLAKNAELNLAGDHDQVARSLEWFEHYWEQSSPYDLAALYKAQWEPYSPWQVFVRMLFELYGNTLGDDQSFQSSLFELTHFQQDGVIRMKRLLKSLGGVLVADEVGLGKSFMAGELIREATEELKQQVLILAPASIKTAMWEPFLERYNFSRWAKVMSYDALRQRLAEDSPDVAATMLDLERFALVIVDEAHNLRNSAAQRSLAVEKAILVGGNKKVVLLTATPVNNSLMDLDALLRLFIRNDSQFAHLNIPSIRKYIENAQRKDPETLRPEHLFDLMDQVAVKRTRKFIKDHYEGETIIGPNGAKLAVEFPEPNPYKIEYDLGEQGSALVDSVIEALHVPDDEGRPRYHDVKDNPNQLILARYLSSRYRKDELLETVQVGNAGLLRSALLKRLESSPRALMNTLQTMVSSHKSFLNGLENGYVLTGATLEDWSQETSSADADFDEFLESLDEEQQEKAESLENFQAEDLIDDVKRDIVLLSTLARQAAESVATQDTKFDQLVVELTQIAEAAAKPDSSHRGRSDSDRRKVIIFSTFSDTVLDIYERLTHALSTASGPLAHYVGRLAPAVMGSEVTTKAQGASGGVDQKRRAQVLEEFAPRTIGLEFPGQEKPDLFDILVTTDVLAEGVNLQQAGRIINYDLPWNPMRIVQRHGRVDRIGSPHPQVDFGLFFPAQKLDALLGLENTIRKKVAQAEAAVGAVGLDVFSKNGGLEVNLADAAEAVGQIRDLLVNRGAALAQSGEEYRRRLQQHLNSGTKVDDKLSRLPVGIGSGFVNPRVGQTGYVFCLRMGSHETPWFRFVETDEQWAPLMDTNGSAVVSDEALVSLVIADPQDHNTERRVSAEAFDRAFDAWAIAREHAFTRYSELTDPAAMEPKPPKAFRDAKALIAKSAQHLTGAAVDDAVLRLQSVPLKKVERKVGQILKKDVSKKLMIDEIIDVLVQNGVQPNPKPKPLAPISEEQVQVVAWMAVEGTYEKG